MLAPRSSMTVLVRAVALAALAASFAGCATLLRNPVPPELTAEATIPGMPEVRAWAGRPDAAMERDLELSLAQESPADFLPGADGVVRYPHLTLSGGGANGAFGAGFLSGWTETGRRPPVFKIVTGVSTGALMAPFAFLGPEYDGALREFYTTIETRDIFAIGSLLVSLLRGDSLADTGPLASLIARHVDAGFLRKIADAHGRGRRLYIGTVDLDAQQFVVWNMGLIATSGHPDALELFRKVMLASASVPIAFPPVFFDVEAGGQRYDEMHVDGAVAARVFLSGGVFRFSAIRERAGRGVGREDIFVIHNGQLVSPPSPTRRSLRGIATRVLEASSRSAVVGDLFRIYAVALREQATFHWVTIAQNVDLAGAEVFDPAKMAELYEVGYKAAFAGPLWETDPPGLRWQETPP
ncbi:MAG TPA: patatin-like phospholipase family protein [Burkholderiales bacterium]|nr:patatin-like phospholipase family protein [Burkholderiales bacterium]